MEMENLGEAKASKESEVQRQMNILNESICNLRDRIGELENSLGKVLRGGSDDKEDGPPNEVLVPLAVDIRSNRHSIEDCTFVMNSMISRLEL